MAPVEEVEVCLEDGRLSFVCVLRSGKERERKERGLWCVCVCVCEREREREREREARGVYL